MHYLPGARRVAGFLLFGLLAGCGGGNGGDAATQTQISTNAISFSAAGPLAATPTAQAFTATFGENIAHLAVVHSGAAIASATSVLNGRTATITVEPTSPSTMGAGDFTGAIAVTGYTCADTTCSRLSAGSTSTIAVSYRVSPLVQFVGPYVATSGVADSVAIRGVGFGSFSITGTRFGDTAGTELSVVSATELRATHPALPAGTYTVRVEASNHQDEIPSLATLVVVDPVAHAATTLAYPAAATAIRNVIYDAERQALFVVSSAQDGSILRYPYANGAWGAPTVATGGFLDAAPSANGTQLIALTTTTVVPVDPVTLAQGTVVTAPSLATNSFLKNIVIGNQNLAVITTSLTTSGTTYGYFYDLASATVGLNNAPINNGTPAIAGNGSVGIISQGDPTLTADLPIYVYSASAAPASSLVASTSVSLRQNAVPPAIDRGFSRFVINGLQIYDGAYNRFGTLPDTTQAVVLKPNGTRAYAYDSTAGGIVVYDLTADRDEALAPALGTVPVAADPGSGVRMTITPDGGTLFLAGTTQVVVQPTPAL